MSLALKLPLAPLLLAQALYARFRVPRLPEAAGPREGSVGAGTALGLWIVGDSSAAGVGAQSQDEALAGRLVVGLAARAHVQVRWRLFARSGITTAQASALLCGAHADAEADIAVIVTGVNDVVDQVPPARAVAARTRLLAALRERHRVRHVVFTPLPPMQHFGGLPQPLRWIAGRDAAAHERALAAWAAGQDGVSHLNHALPLDDPALLARDGFHPAPALYRHWGEQLAAHIADQVWPRIAPSATARKRSLA